MKTSIAKAYVQVIPSADGMRSNLSSIFSKEMPSAGQSAGQSFGSNMIGKLKGVIAAAGIGKMISEALLKGADLQQTLGGVETMFKDSADTVIKNAEQAYKNAGMSANEYMETVTGFSASLLQSLEGDTVAAAKAADTALTDMSDNANKLGTDMELIKNAYQGFAKQNYTMLDNLKLGYGGTKTEMQRLLQDAQKLSGVEYDISSLADVYEAIHVIQTEMGITGTTAKEASTTFSGSFASMKSAFSDFLANLPLGRDIGPSLVALEETVFTFIVNNLVPMLGNLLAGLPEALQGALSMAIRGLNMIANNTGEIVQFGLDLVLSLGKAIITAVPYLAEAAWGIVTELGRVIVETDWAQIANDTMTSLRESLDVAAGEILGTDGNIVKSVLDAIAAGFPDLLDQGGKMVSNLITGIFDELPELVDSALTLTVDFVGELLKNLPNIINTGKDILRSLVDGVYGAIPDMLRSGADAVGELLSGVLHSIPDVISSGFELIASLIEGLGEAAPHVYDAIGDVIMILWEAIKETDWLQLGKDIINGLINGLGAMGSALWDAAKNIARYALDAIKNLFGIASPSKVMRDEVGKMLPPGVAIGVEANMDPLKKSMHKLSDVTMDTLKGDLDITGALRQSASSTAAYRGGGATSPEDLLSRILQALESLGEQNMVGMNTSVLVLRDLLEAVLNIQIGDDVIFTAVERHRLKQTVIGGA